MLDKKNENREVGESRGLVVLVAFYFPPKQFSGSVRAANIANALVETGYKVLVVTPSASVFPNVGMSAIEIDSRVSILETGYSFGWFNPDTKFRVRSVASKLLSAVCSRMARAIFHDYEAGWCVDLARALRGLDRDVSAVVATASPYVTIATVAAWARRRKVPMIVDYRDLLMGNPHRRGGQKKWSLISSLERRWLRQASAVTTVSPSWVELLRNRKECAGKVYLLYNGFGSSLATKHGAVNIERRIVYSGIFLPPKRSAEPIIQALALLRPELNCVLDYFGPDVEHVRQLAVQYGVLSRVVLHGVRPHDEVVAALRRASASIVVSSAGQGRVCPSEDGIIPAKLYEAMSAGVPVIALCSESSDMAAILSRTGAGKSFSFHQSQDVANTIIEFITNPRRVEPAAEFSWQSIGSELSRIIEVAKGTEVANNRGA